MPWNGKYDTLITRFDGRALLDILPTAQTASAEVFNHDGRIYYSIRSLACEDISYPNNYP